MNTGWRRALLATAMMVFASPASVFAENSTVGKFTVVSGSVDAIREQQDAPVAAEIGMETYMQDIVRTKHRSRTRLKFIDDSVLNMGSDYMVKIKEYVYDEDNGIRRAILSSLRGTMRATVSKFGGDSTFEVETPTAIASVRGTDFIVKVNSSLETEVIVLEGAVRVRNIDPLIRGQVMVRAGQKTTIVKASAPSAPAYVPPKIQRTLVAETTPSGPQGRSPGQTISPAEAAPVARLPAASMPFVSQRIAPAIRGVQTSAGGAPPVQPPITHTIPGIITTPVGLTLVF